VAAAYLNPGGKATASCLTRLRDVNSPIFLKVEPKVVVSVVDVTVVEGITRVAVKLMFFPEKFHVRLINLYVKRTDTYLLSSKNSKVILMFFFTFLLLKA
jgi:hypothetical protein